MKTILLRHVERIALSILTQLILFLLLLENCYVKLNNLQLLPRYPYKKEFQNALNVSVQREGYPFSPRGSRQARFWLLHMHRSNYRWKVSGNMLDQPIIFM